MGSESPIDTFRFCMRSESEAHTLVFCMTFPMSMAACEAHQLHFYTDKIQVSTSAGGCILLTLHPAFLGPTFRQYRALMYTCFGLSAILFISHSIFLYGFAIQKRRLSIEWMALMSFLNIAGAVIYASRVSLLLVIALSRWHVTNR